MLKNPQRVVVRLCFYAFVGENFELFFLFRFLLLLLLTQRERNKNKSKLMEWIECLVCLGVVTRRQTEYDA